MAATLHPRSDLVRGVDLHARPLTASDRTELPEPNYVLRRVVAAVVGACVLAASAIAVGEVVGALSDLGGRPAAASEVTPGIRTPAVHVAAPGDTLWSIADRYRGEVGRDRYVGTLIALNGGSAAIEVGQAVRLP